jgi:hypothetical protein
MADPSKIGTDWTDEELDLIVADHFAMLAAEQAGEPYVKARHAQKLMAEIGRTHRSVEFKHMNVSAVLSVLGLPTIRGYRPKANYQAAIFPAIYRYMSSHPDVWDIGQDRLVQAWRRGGTQTDPTRPLGPGWSDEGEAFTPAPLLVSAAPPVGSKRARPQGLQRLVRKFDPAARDARNRVLGRLGERHVLHHEIAGLIAADRMDLAKKVEWTADVHGDGAGYDIRSFDPTGAERLIEVKSTRGGPTTDFYLTRTEREVSEERPEAWRLYRLHGLPDTPSAFVLPPPLERHVTLTPEAWKASF